MCAVDIVLYMSTRYVCSGYCDVHEYKVCVQWILCCTGVQGMCAVDIVLYRSTRYVCSGYCDVHEYKVCVQ